MKHGCLQAENIFDRDTATLFLRTKLADQLLSKVVFLNKYHSGRDIFAHVAATHVGFDFYPAAPPGLCEIVNSTGLEFAASAAAVSSESLTLRH